MHDTEPGRWQSAGAFKVCVEGQALDVLGKSNHVISFSLVWFGRAETNTFIFMKIIYKSIWSEA
jgi:hypothetical protein